MEIVVSKVSLKEVQPLRDLFLAGMAFQFVYNKCHGAGWADTYLITIDGEKAGYGSVWGKDKREDRDAIFEFYLLEPYRKRASIVFPQFQKASAAAYVECQTNDQLLADMLFEFCTNIYADRILFEDDFETDLKIPGTAFKKNYQP